MVFLYRQISFGSVDNHNNTFFNVLKSFETFQEIFCQFRQLICSCLTDVRLIDHQDDFDFGINIEQSLNEKRVGDFVFFSFVILESRAVVESEVIDD